MPNKGIKTKLVNIIERNSEEGITMFVFRFIGSYTLYLMFLSENVMLLSVNSYINFGTKSYKEIMGIWIANDYAPLSCWRFVSVVSHKKHYAVLLHENQLGVIKTFNFAIFWTTPFIDYAYFDQTVYKIYKKKLQFIKALRFPSHKTTWCKQTLNLAISWHIIVIWKKKQKACDLNLKVIYDLDIQLQYCKHSDFQVGRD